MVNGTRIAIILPIEEGDICVNDLGLDGPCVLSLNDEYHFVSPELWGRLKSTKFNCLVLSEGLLDFPESTGKTLTKKEADSRP